jgi:Transglutaminase-like superfamily.
MVQYHFLITGFFMVMLILPTGCHSTQKQGLSAQGNNHNLEALLMNDIQDGRLDMPFDQACLIASGVDTGKRMNTYLKKIELLISRIRQETEINTTGDPLKKADIIFDWLQSNANDGTYSDCYDFRDTLNLKVGNCLSYAIRFTIVSREFGIDIKNIFIPGHIYNRLVFEGQTRYFEHTHSDGIVKKKDLYNSQKKVMKDEELVAEIFLYKARNANNDLKYAESSKRCEQALLFNPDDSRPVILLLDNYIAQKNYREAFRYLSHYLDQHPNDRISFNNTYILLQRLCAKEDAKTQ